MASPPLNPTVASSPAAETEVLPSTKPFVSVIIPVYNDIERLLFCLDALEAQSYPSDRYEVVVVDNGSKEAIAPHLGAFAHVMPAFEGRPGSYVARNRGIATARGDVLAFTDADCIPEADWLEQGVATLAGNPACGLVAGNVRVFSDSEKPSLVEIEEVAFSFGQADYAKRGFGATANVFTRREVFEAVGTFREDLKSCGDLEWGTRVRDRGFKVLYSEAAIVKHPARKSWKDVRSKMTRICGGHFQLARMQGGNALTRRRKLFWALKPPIFVAMRLVNNDRVPGLSQKLGVLAVIWYQRLTFLQEWLRLEFGKTANR